MNFSIITSFTVGGLMLVALLTLSRQVLVNSANTTLDLDAKNKIGAISAVITQDLMKIGYNSTSSDIEQMFTSTNTKKITFEADVYNDGTAETITWQFLDGEPYTATRNPHDYKLVRTGPVEIGGPNIDIVFPAVHFELTYYDIDGNAMNPAGITQKNIRRIEVEVACESSEPSMDSQGGEDTYQRSFWKRKVIPSTLQIK